jgi:multidrug transporter EmrE-like cation transporter
LDSTLAAHKRRSVLLVLCCTVFGAIAQVLIKTGAPKLGVQPSLAHTALSILTNAPIMSGLVLYGLSTVLLVLALRHGDLSMIYPVIALTFVWVTILSAIVFGESMNAYKISGIAIIVAGVSILGVGARR